MGNEAATIDNGFELTQDGFVLHPRPSQYRTAALVGSLEMVCRCWVARTVGASGARISRASVATSELDGIRSIS